MSTANNLGYQAGALRGQSPQLISYYIWQMLRRARPAPLSGRKTDLLEEMQYTISYEELNFTLSEMKKYGVKPEYELFDIGDLMYLRDLISEGVIANDAPHWVQMVLPQF
jgi:uncharacterized protein (DUF849 family)